MAIEVNVRKKLGDFQLDINFSAGDEIMALLGASGCGKSVTLKCIAGIEKPDEGRITLDGRILFDSSRHINLKPQARKAGYLFQQYALFPNMTVEQNISAGLRNREKKDIVPEIIHSMHLDGMEKMHPFQLSGGQQQRVALARILVNDPEVLMLDEPFSALDSHLRFQMEQEVREVARQFGKTVLLVSHDQGEVYRLADRIAVMDNGHIEVVGEPHEVFQDPVTRNGASLVGCKNITPIERRGPHRIYARDWGIELTVAAEVKDDAAFAGVHTHSFALEGEENRILFDVIYEVENPYSMTIIIRPHGVDSDKSIDWEVDKDTWSAIRGDRVELYIPPESILLLKEADYV